jgi:predicted XRE-type DNA-binding protein
MKKVSAKLRHITYGNIIDELCFPPEHPVAMKFKAELYQSILKFAKKCSQKELQIILAEPQPRVSELLNGKIANKSVDKLLHYAGRLGLEAKAKFTQTYKVVVEKEVALADCTEQSLGTRQPPRYTN